MNFHRLINEYDDLIRQYETDSKRPTVSRPFFYGGTGNVMAICSWMSRKRFPSVDIFRAMVSLIHGGRSLVRSKMQAARSL